MVANDDALVALAAHARPGQGPTFAFFAAVHVLLLGGAEHELSAYYPSLQGDSARSPDAAAGRALADFARVHAVAIARLLETRLVQTNHVQRAMALRLGLAVVGQESGATPVHLLEVGSSAGLVLRQDRYGYHLAGRGFGDRASAIQLRAEWRAAAPAPDLDTVPPIAAATGVDLNPLDPADAADRSWLRALVWPENRAQTRLLDAALNLAAEDPIDVLAGDAIDRCPDWARGVPYGAPRVVFHCATRMHVPAERRPAFDAAIADAGRDGPLWVISVDGPLRVTGPDGRSVRSFDVDGHLDWVRPC